MGDAPDRHQRAQTRQSGDAADQELTAGRNLGRRRLVLGRHAADRIRDHAIDQLERVRRAQVVAPAGKPDLEQRAVEQLAGVVAEKGPPGAVRALQPGSEADDEEPRAVRAKGGNRAVEPIRMRGLVRFTERHQTRAERTAFGRLGRGLRSRVEQSHASHSDGSSFVVSPASRLARRPSADQSSAPPPPAIRARKRSEIRLAIGIGTSRSFAAFSASCTSL